jgi:ATP-dependent Lon protease
LQLDELDLKVAEVFEGYIVRKDLVRKFRQQFPVPTYVVEFLLGRYCATTNENEIEEGLEVVQRQLSSKSVRAGEEELFKAKAYKDGSVKLIDLISATFSVTEKGYLAKLPSLQLNKVRISDQLVDDNQRILTGGFYAEITLEYDDTIANEKAGMPFGIQSIRPIQLSKNDVLDILAVGRRKLTTAEWKDFLLRSIGIEPSTLNERAKNAFLLRMVPFVERNYNMVELGPRGTGKSHLFQQISPYAHLISGANATVAKMFVNNSTGQRGLVLSV